MGLRRDFGNSINQLFENQQQMCFQINNKLLKKNAANASLSAETAFWQ
jgi:hypothetical protein